VFRAAPGVDAIKALRFMLKGALRRHGLRALSVRETSAQLVST
jgi:hypothetical protein